MTEATAAPSIVSVGGVLLPTCETALPKRRCGDVAKLTLTMTADELRLIRQASRERGFPNAAIFAKEEVMGRVLRDLLLARQRRAQQAIAQRQAAAAPE